MSPEHKRLRDFHIQVLELNGGSMFYCEPHITALYRAILQPGSVVVDGGANIGLHTLQMAQAVLPDGLVVAIEPIPEVRASLESRLRDYHIPVSVTRILPYALSSKGGEAEFFQVLHPIEHELSGLHQREILNNHQVKKIVVELATLDTICRGLNRLEFLKLDLEGAELDALYGGRSTVQKFRPVIALEQSQDSLRYYGYKWQDLVDYFTSLNYRLYDLFGLVYTEPEMFDQCAVWDFVGLPDEYPAKTTLFKAVRCSMEARGIILPDAQVRKPVDRSTPFCVLDRIGAVSRPMEREFVRCSGDTSIEFSGWAVDRDGNTLARRVEITVGDKVYDATYGYERGDIAAYFNNAGLLNSGFALTLAAGTLAKGQHVVSLRVLSREKMSFYEGPRVRFEVL